MTSPADIARAALAHERVGRWSDARGAWASLREIRSAAAVSRRAKQCGLAPGQTLQHTRRGQVLATCTYEITEGREGFVYASCSYPTASAAARAAATSLGYRCPVSYNGWVFWGVEKKADARRARLSRT